MVQQKENLKSPFLRFFMSRLFLILGFIVAVLVAFSYMRAYYQDYAIRQEIIRLESEVRRLEHKKLESFKLLNYVLSDDYVEEKARIELNLKKPGENVLVISEDGVSKHKQKSLAVFQEDLPTLKNPVKWWYYFTHKDISNI